MRFLVSTMSNLLNVSAAIFLEPCMHIISGLYSSRISLYLISVPAKFLWSVSTLICCPNNMFLNSFTVTTIESYSYSVVI